jgi:hypothetical protein
MRTFESIGTLTRLRGFAHFEEVHALFINALDEKIFTTSGGVSECGCGDFRRGLRQQLQPELPDQKLEFALGLGVAGQHQLTPVGRRQMDVDHLHGGELFQRTARAQPGCEGMKAALECHLQTVGQECDEDMSLDPALVLMTRLDMGLSAYDPHSGGSGVAYASRHRPLQNFCPTGRHWNFNLDLFIISWLEHLGVDYDVITEEDLHREGLDLLRPNQLILTGSHPEYDSVEMLDAMQAYLRQGGRLMYMGNNGFYWRIAHHPEREGVIEVRRAGGGVLVWNALPGEFHHSFSGEYGGL